MARSVLTGFLAAAGYLFVAWAAGAPLPAIETVEVRPNRAFAVNGKPFFPIMAWLQDAKNFPAAAECGMNTTAGYWPKSSGTRDVVEYVERVRQAGLYGVMPFDPRLKGHPALLGYIHDDEPDLPRQVSDATVEPGPGLRVNQSTPLWRLVDGVTNSWTALDPLEGANVTVRLPAPVTVKGLAVSLTISPGLSVASEIVFEGDGRLLLRPALDSAKRGQQRFDLPPPATFRDLKVTVTAAVAGQNVWGSLGEVEAFDAAGKNVLLSPPRTVTRQTPEQTLAHYRAIKAADASRPVFMTFTGNFHPVFKKWSEAELGIYPRFIEAADVAGFDIYPIYGWNKPEWLHLVQEGTDRLVRLAGTRPVYAWIETGKGGQYTGPLEKQKPVLPEHIRAEVWMAICRGATAVGYFTHVWKPAYSQFGVPPENRVALRQINEQVARLTPAILGTSPATAVTVETTGGVKVDVLARESAGALTVFAVNYDERQLETTATVRVPGLAAGTEVQVLDEGRSLKAEAGAFVDRFAPLAVHIYRVAR